VAATKAELSVSVNTIRTHLRHVYEKLGAHSRAEAVERARALSLLTPSSQAMMQRPDPMLRAERS
jgi:LuxR family maltose regulon positive regulatory protein